MIKSLKIQSILQLKDTDKFNWDYILSFEIIKITGTQWGVDRVSTAELCETIAEALFITISIDSIK